MKALVLVAHPDDEVLFLGSTILAHPDWEWDIVSFTHDWEDWRGREFAEAHKALHYFGGSVTSAMLGLADEDVPESEFSVWEDRFLEWLAQGYQGWDRVYTHNRVGEYGHPHHIAVNVIARRHFCFDAPVFEFYYPPVVPGTPPLWWGDAEFDFACDPRKSEVFHRAYGGHYSTLKAHQPALINFLLGANVDMVTR